MTNWITLYPQWFIAEQESLARSYPDFRIDEGLLQQGIVCYYGELVVRPSGGAKRFPVRLIFLDVTPFGFPYVTPIESLPDFDDEGCVDQEPKEVYFNRRHQMPGGGLCLFQQETRGTEGGESIRAVDVLNRAEQWFIGHLTGRWPPDSHESELENHFYSAGNVLLSGSFYDADIKGRGYFYLVRDIQRLVNRTTEEDPPLIVTVVSTVSESGVEIPRDACEELVRTFPWLGNKVWSPEGITELEEKRGQDGFLELFTEKGFWWSLKNEPEPFRDGSGLLKVLEEVAPDGDAWTMVSTAMRGDFGSSSQHFFGLRYPGRQGRDEWLILTLLTAKKEKTPGGGLVLNLDESSKKTDFETGQVFCYRVHGATQDEIYLRNETVIDSSIREKTVLLIGLGALGSKVAELLAQAGVGEFRFCDPDRLTTGNVSRHVGGISDFGERKTRVVSNRLHNINPHLKQIQAWEGYATDALSTLSSMIQDVDLVVSTIADENAESAINQVAVVDKVPVLYGRAMRRGSMGRVFLVRPGVDPCKRCIGLHAASAEAGHESDPDWISVSERDEDVLLHECGRPVIPASAIDLSFVASLAARQALTFLEGNAGTENHWLWSQSPALDVDARLDGPLASIQGTIQRNSACPACREPDVATVKLSNDDREFIRSEVEASPSTETGGILVGYVEARTAIVTRVIGPGPKAVKTATRFEKDIDYVQIKLEKAVSELGEEGRYIGEWHSHLVADPEPSGRDVASLTGIAESPNYATHCPIMLIAGYDKTEKELVQIKAWSFPIGGRAYSISVSNHEN